MTGSINRKILEFSFQIADDMKARAVILFVDVVPDPEILDNSGPRVELIFVAKGDEKISKGIQEYGRVLRIPDVNLTRIGQIKTSIIKGIAAGLIKKGDKVICLNGMRDLGYIDTMMIIDIGKEYEILTSENVSGIFEGFHPEVFEAVLNIALELGTRGREGRSVGATFILGDHEKVLQNTLQMIINPFLGYSEEERNILNPALKATVTSFSALDGAFILKYDGVLVTAGSYLNAALESIDLPKGLGSRHLAAAGITAVTKAVAIVVSESTGTVRVFKDGKILISIEKPA